MKKYCVYAVICPFINEVIYIGITRASFWNLKNRLKQHLHDVTTYNKELNEWSKKLRVKKETPIGIILTYHKSKKEAFENEIKTINFFRKNGVKLLNINPKKINNHENKINTCGIG